MIRRLLVLYIGLFALAAGVSAAVPMAQTESVRTERLPAPVPHPRLLLRGGEEEAVRERIAAEPEVALADSIILAACGQMLGQPPVERVKTGKRLLHVSREALKRIFYLSYAWRIHGGEAYAERAVREMMAVCRFKDWNPTHYLDVGEMTMAVAIGYDWLYPVLTQARRDSVAAAVRRMAFETSRNRKHAWFYGSNNNWNQVCNAGLSFGAIALYEAFPDEADALLGKCLETIPQPLGAYSPEGGYPEGYNYWGYGSSFQILLLAALESAYGTDFGLLEQHGAGFLRTGEFLRMLSTPTGHAYNFYDSGRNAYFQYMQAYLGRISNDLSLLKTELGIFRRTRGRSLCEDRLFPFFPIAMARFPVALKDLPDPDCHTFTCGGTTPVFIYRSGWNSPNDTYFAVKGGLSMSSHGHCDQGSFYFEQDGVVWATDLGMQDYESLESKRLDIWKMHQESVRWNVFRIGPFSHNILTVNAHVPKVNHPAALDETWTEGAVCNPPGAGKPAPIRTHSSAGPVDAAHPSPGSAVPGGRRVGTGRPAQDGSRRIGAGFADAAHPSPGSVAPGGGRIGAGRQAQDGTGRIGAGLNLTALYSEDLDSCYRRVFLDGGDLVVEDYVTARDKACTLRWALCSETEACVRDGRILLSKDGRTRTLTIEALRPLKKHPNRYAKPPRRTPIPVSAHVWAVTWPGSATHEASDAPDSTTPVEAGNVPDRTVPAEASNVPDCTATTAAGNVLNRTAPHEAGTAADEAVRAPNDASTADDEVVRAPNDASRASNEADKVADVAGRAADVAGRAADVAGRAAEEAPCSAWPESPLHSYDAPNPGVSLSGFVIELQPRETVLLRIRMTATPQPPVRKRQHAD